MAGKIFTEDNIILNANPADRWEAIRICGELLEKNGYVEPGYTEAMWERERTASVYLGNHVAIPHGVVGSENKILESGICFLQTPQGISFDNGEKAYVFIGIAGKNDTHVEILSRIANVCCDLEKVEQLRNTKDKAEVIQILGQEDETWME